MPQLQAVNNFTLILRDETSDTINGFSLPDSGQEKPHKGKIISVGQVSDKNIKPNKDCLFHKGNGWEMEYEGNVYLVLESEKIIAVI